VVLAKAVRAAPDLLTDRTPSGSTPTRARSRERRSAGVDPAFPPHHFQEVDALDPERCANIRDTWVHDASEPLLTYDRAGVLLGERYHEGIGSGPRRTRVDELRVSRQNRAHAILDTVAHVYEQPVPLTSPRQDFVVLAFEFETDFVDGAKVPRGDESR
jgi:hypothetical protein